MYLFSRFFASWTPFFLVKYRNDLTLGKSIGYYFFWWFILSIVLIVSGVVTAFHFTTMEKVLPIFDRVPSFSFEFIDNELVKTSFPTDPYTISVYDELRKFIPEGNIDNDIDYIYFSSEETSIPADLADTRTIFFLRDGIVTTRLADESDNVKEPYEFGTVTIDNAFVRTKIQEKYPEFRSTVLPIIVIIFGGFILFFIIMAHFFFAFIWAGILSLLCLITGMPKLTYAENLAFTYYTHFIDVIISYILWFSIWSISSSIVNTIVGSVISLAIFFVNIHFLKKHTHHTGHSHSTHKN